MKIFAVARNYADDSCVSPYGEGFGPVWYELPDSAQLHTHQPFFVPDFGNDFRIMPSVAWRISRLGKGIQPRYACRYIDAVGLGCNVIAADLLARLRSEGLPWASAVAFDKSCFLSDWSPVTADNENLPMPVFSIRCGKESLEYHTAAAIHDIGIVLQSISRDITIKNGDVILSAIHPRGLHALTGDKFIAQTSDNNSKQSIILDINIR